ncbi:hypothetical protein [Klebsiella grimontii]|nr:hypothetical protein [Klebsiella grimontii]HDH7817596.1 hypothetical protein [Raoultella ornithinolytica]HDT5148091.1 hypothetical protein [Klebsiella michiganensis]MBZ6571525.1 hypothetical protein [Klebsiella grimontii]MBZ7378409.1 hypothetical protein [Klebsiella grimontii]MBZ7674687.1 hypothetical protein [Klebsiella grimontii]
MNIKKSLNLRPSDLSKKSLYFQCMMYVVFLTGAIIFTGKNLECLINGMCVLWGLFVNNFGLAVVLVFSVFFAMVLSVSAGGYPYDDFKPVLIFYGNSVSVVCQVFALLVLRAWQWDFFAVAGTFLLTQFITGYMTGGIQRDISEGRVLDDAFHIIAELWVLLPMSIFCWGVSWVYYTALFNS